MARRILVINHMPFFRFPFYPYSRTYPRNTYHTSNLVPIDNQKTPNNHSSTFTEIGKTGDTSHTNKNDTHEKKSSKYYGIGPIFINTNGFSNKEEPLLEISGRKLYLDDFIILSLLYFLYKEDVKDDMLFILLILLLVG